ncbi:Lactamase-B domain-containing protein [Favolaschia claudopus]|uniref:Lactamase-B domain-containing protein n=1 Tax=Favolaschia claudopus TaxID=2862362 RepID=A0AAV9ZM44_9AGAR
MTSPSHSHPLPKPSGPNQPYMHISALQAGFVAIPNDVVIQGSTPTYQNCPSLAFYLRHSHLPNGGMIFDLGLRKNWETYPPEAQRNFQPGAMFPCTVPQDVAESCREGGVDPGEVECVVISHLHFDHVGDCSPFTKATFILGGEAQASLDDGYPENPHSAILAASTPRDRTRFLTKEDFDTSIGPFPHAHDLFQDGSVYVIDTPGHSPGHLTLLARTSPTGAWLFLGADVAHDKRLLTDPRTRIATTRENGESFCVHRDPVQAEVDLGRVRRLLLEEDEDGDGRVEAIIAHDWKWCEENLGRAFLPGRIVPRD